MRHLTLFPLLPLVLLLAACDDLPFGRLATPADAAAFTQQRGAVELVVKSGFDRIIPQIAAGGGPVLTEAYDAAGVPPADREARTIQLQSDLPFYRGNPGALVNRLILFGGAG